MSLLVSVVSLLVSVVSEVVSEALSLLLVDSVAVDSELLVSVACEVSPSARSSPLLSPVQPVNPNTRTQSFA